MVVTSQQGAPGTIWWTGVMLGFGLLGLLTSILPLIGVLFFAASLGIVLTRKRVRGLRAIQAMTVALSGNIFTLGHSLWLFSFPRGFSIRPMIWNAEVLVVGVGCFILVCLLALAAIAETRKWLLASVAAALALEGVFLGWQVLGVAVRTLDLRISE
jgi:hypothetical protein